MNAFSILFTDTFNNENVGELTNIRSVASIPFGGRYRLIDFMLSSLVNANVRNIGVIMKNKYNSLADHLGTGKDWDLNRKNGGIKLLLPYAQSQTGEFRSRIEALCGIDSFIYHMLPEYCIITEGNMVCNIDFSDVLRFHAAQGADMTVLYKETESAADDDTEITLDQNGRIIDALYHSGNSEKKCNVIMRVYVLSKVLLKHIIDQGATFGWKDINRDYIAPSLKTANIIGYKHNGYCKVIRNVSDYYSANMDLLKFEVRNDLFNGEHKIYTKVKDSVPAKYGDSAKVMNSLVADGCKIDGTVENCILFRDVVIKKDALVHNSIIMQGTVVEENAQVSGIIADKDVTITRSRALVGSPSLPVVIAKDLKV